MNVLIQRVKEAQVIVNEQTVATMNAGLLLFVGICKEDDEAVLEKMARKIAMMRIFSDEDDKMNLNIQQVQGEIISVSQFTLCANHTKGHRPSFDRAKNPQEANKMFEQFNDYLRSYGITLQTGVFGEHMNVLINNDGPVTFHLEMESEQS